MNETEKHRLGVTDMCKYCEWHKSQKEKTFDITIVNTCLVVGNECSCGYDRARFNINYCPMCGRKLEDE